MSTRDMIRAEIDTVPDDQLGDLYSLIKRFRDSHTPAPAGILSKLRTVAIDGPPDFAANLDLYLSGEKRVGEDVP